MTENKARRAAQLLNEIKWSKDTICRLKDERVAKLTGLAYDAPGPKHHVLETIDREWGLLGKKCVDFFITAMDEAIADQEEYFVALKKALEEL